MFASLSVSARVSFRGGGGGEGKRIISSLPVSGGPLFTNNGADVRGGGRRCSLRARLIAADTPAEEFERGWRWTPRRLCLHQECEHQDRGPGPQSINPFTIFLCKRSRILIYGDLDFYLIDRSGTVCGIFMRYHVLRRGSANETRPRAILHTQPARAS